MGIEEDSRARDAINALKSGELTPQGKKLRELALLHIDFAINEANTADSDYGKKILDAANLHGWMADYVEINRHDTTTDNDVPVTHIEAYHPYYLEPFVIASIGAIPVDDSLVLVLNKLINPLPKFRSYGPIIRESASCNQVHEPELIIRRFLTEKPNETIARIATEKAMKSLKKQHQLENLNHQLNDEDSANKLTSLVNSEEYKNVSELDRRMLVSKLLANDSKSAVELGSLLSAYVGDPLLKEILTNFARDKRVDSLKILLNPEGASLEDQIQNLSDKNDSKKK